MAKNYPAQNFLNRELGLLEFNRRVLAQAEDPSVPLLERLKYLCIVSSNLDEFFEIRVAGLKEQVKLGGIASGPDGLEASQILKRLFAPDASAHRAAVPDIQRRAGSRAGRSRASSSSAVPTGMKHSRPG